MTFNILNVDESEGKFLQTTLSEKVFDIMVEGWLQFVIEDKFRLSLEQGYWCRHGEPDM